MSKQIMSLIAAYEKGYRVINGEVISPFSGESRKQYSNSAGYLQFSIKIKGNNYKVYNIDVHRLVAYQKFGDKLFEEGIEVRHLDNNKLNNFDDNIDIGTHQENMMDIPKEQRIYNASRHSKKFSNDKINQIRYYHQNVKSYKKTMEFFGITSKGTLHNLLNKNL